MKKLLTMLRNGAYFVLSCALTLAAVWILGFLVGLMIKLFKSGLDVW